MTDVVSVTAPLHTTAVWNPPALPASPRGDLAPEQCCECQLSVFADHQTIGTCLRCGEHAVCRGHLLCEFCGVDMRRCIGCGCELLGDPAVPGTEEEETMVYQRGTSSLDIGGLDGS